MQTGNALILGQQGSGKSSLARYIHQQSGRGKRGAALVEYFSTPAAKALEYSALFGYWVGAHSTANANVRGAAEEAHRGTLLIDEVHNLASETQQQLLQFCRPDNEGRRWFRRLGNFPLKGATEARDSVRGTLDKTYRIAVDVMLLSATNERIDDPSWRAEHGFSEPLYTRLAVDYAGEPLRFPSLAKRKEDIPLLFEFFLKQETEKIGGRTNEQGRKSLDAEVAERLCAHDWPANVAELRGVAHQAARNAKDFPVVFARHLPKFGEVPVTTDPIPRPPAPFPQPAANSLADAERVLRSVQVPQALNEELRGRLAPLEDAYALLIKNVLEVTLEQMKNVRGDDRFCLPALRFLFGKEEIETAAQAYSKVLSLYKLFKKAHPPTPGSTLDITIERAKKNRTMTGRKGKEDEDE
jgi:DNA-binding NtrC family response regulator